MTIRMKTPMPPKRLILTRTANGYSYAVEGDERWWEIENDGDEWAFRYRSSAQREAYAGRDPWSYAPTLQAVREYLLGRLVARWAFRESTEWRNRLRALAASTFGVEERCTGTLTLLGIQGHDGCCDLLSVPFLEAVPLRSGGRPYRDEEIERFRLYGRAWEGTA